jgi:hypothetical protein
VRVREGLPPIANPAAYFKAWREAKWGGRIGAALRRLKDDDRAFARAVLKGKAWVEMGCPKRTFYWRLKKLEDFFRLEKQG